LRGDAAYFLLLNFDQMLFRVEGPYPPMVLDRPSERISASVREIYPADRLNNIFDIIMEQLTKTSPDDDGYSAHQVIRAIDGGWPEIIKYVLWE
jgi:hypothetical protein